jgi:hypothetical protein
MASAIGRFTIWTILAITAIIIIALLLANR